MLSFVLIASVLGAVMIHTRNKALDEQALNKYHLFLYLRDSLIQIPKPDFPVSCTLDGKKFSIKTNAAGICDTHLIVRRNFEYHILNSSGYGKSFYLSPPASYTGSRSIIMEVQVNNFGSSHYKHRAIFNKQNFYWRKI